MPEIQMKFFRQEFRQHVPEVQETSNLTFRQSSGYFNLKFRFLLPEVKVL
jgi:hypothetical protein